MDCAFFSAGDAAALHKTRWPDLPSRGLLVQPKALAGTAAHHCRHRPRGLHTLRPRNN